MSMKKLLFTLALVAILAMAGCASNTPNTAAADTAAADKAAADKAAADKTAADKTVKPQVAAPSITSISPTKGRQGSNVTIAGNNFGADAQVLVDGNTSAKIVSLAPNKIVITFPTGLPIGKHTVTVVSNGATSNGVEFIDP